jgi:hypothetical protein
VYSIRRNWLQGKGDRRPCHRLKVVSPLEWGRGRWDERGHPGEAEQEDEHGGDPLDVGEPGARPERWRPIPNAAGL